MGLAGSAGVGLDAERLGSWAGEWEGDPKNRKVARTALRAQLLPSRNCRRFPSDARYKITTPRCTRCGLTALNSTMRSAWRVSYQPPHLGMNDTTPSTALIPSLTLRLALDLPMVR